VALAALAVPGLRLALGRRGSLELTAVVAVAVRV
jgi:hypothetical protein